MKVVITKDEITRMVQQRLTDAGFKRNGVACTVKSQDVKAIIPDEQHGAVAFQIEIEL